MDGSCLLWLGTIPTTAQSRSWAPHSCVKMLHTVNWDTQSRSHDSQYESAFRDELAGSGTLTDVAMVIAGWEDLSELVGVEGVGAQALWEAIEFAGSRIKMRQ